MIKSASNGKHALSALPLVVAADEVKARFSDEAEVAGSRDLAHTVSEKREKTSRIILEALASNSTLDKVAK